MRSLSVLSHALQYWPAPPLYAWLQLPVSRQISHWEAEPVEDVVLEEDEEPSAEALSTSRAIRATSSDSVERLVLMAAFSSMEEFPFSARGSAGLALYA